MAKHAWSGQKDGLHCIICGTPFTRDSANAECDTPQPDNPVITSDPVAHPIHYGGKRDPFEAIKVIEAWQLDFCLGNTVKYIRRAGKKDNMLQDLKKARWYLQRRIEQLEKTHG